MTDEELIEDLCRLSAKCDGLEWDEPCGFGPDGSGECNSCSCVAAYYEDHDADWARKVYRFKVEKFLLPAIRAAEARGFLRAKAALRNTKENDNA